MSQEQNDRGRIRPSGSGGDERRTPKFNITWLWVALFVLLLGFNFLGSGFKQTLVKTDVTEFKNTMLRNGDVEKFETVNKKLVRVYIIADSLKKPFYAAKYKESKMKVPKEGPHFEFNADDRILADDLRDFYKDNPQVKEVSNFSKDEPDYFASIINFLIPILLFVLLFILLMRKMGTGGGAGGGGGNFIAASSTYISSGINTGNGYVTITNLFTPATALNFDGSLANAGTMYQYQSDKK